MNRFFTRKTRERLGKEVRAAWVYFATTHGDMKESHLLPWEELDEYNKEVDRFIGEHIGALFIPYPLSWPTPAFFYGQDVYIGGVQYEIVGLRYGHFPIGESQLCWRYQIADMSDYCDEKWYGEETLSPELEKEQ